jgi:hypothetical protein
MFTIIEFFLGLSIGSAILWVTILGLAKFTRRVMGGEQWTDALKDLWKPPPLSGNGNTENGSPKPPESDPGASQNGKKD